MKKRVFALLLVAAIVASMVVVPVSAEPFDGTAATATTETCPCGCGQKLSQVEWQPWDSNKWSAIASGHYYLESDYAVSATQTLIKEKQVVLDLRGHKLTTQTATKIFLVEGQLSVIDTVGGGRMTTKSLSQIYGGVIMVRNNETDNASLTLWNITVMPEDKGQGALNGALIYPSTGTSLTIKDCMILNGVSTGKGGAIHAVEGSTVEISGTTIMSCTAAGNGGAISGAATSTISITDSQIIGCSSDLNGGSIYSNGTVSIKNSKLLGGTAGNCGGNVIQSGGQLTVDNCELAYGTCHGEYGQSTTSTADNYGGGNLSAVNNAQIEVKNNTVIRDGYAYYSGGNVYLTNGTQTFTNTTITGGVSRHYGANLTSFTTTAKTTIDGCSIDGDVRYGGGTLTLKGATKIGLHNNGLDLNTSPGAIDASGLTSGAEIFVEANGVFTKTGANKDYFKPALRTGEITVDETTGGLKAVQVADGELGGYCPHCYDPENPQRVIWNAFGDEENKGGCDENHNLYAGHWYMNVNTAWVYSLNEGVDFVLDLNGKSMTVSNRIFNIKGSNSSLSILDSVGGGYLQAKGLANQSGGVIYGDRVGYTLNIYGGRIAYLEGRTVSSGGVIYGAGDNITMNIHGGIIDGTTQTSNGSNYGGAIFFGNVGTTGKKFNMTAGRILGGEAYYGGAIYLGFYVDADITGGVISGGRSVSSGGNIRASADTTNKAKVGSLYMKDCAVIGGTVTGDSGGGGNIFTENWSPTIENCYIAGGRCDSTTDGKGYGGNLYMAGAATASISDSYLVDGVSVSGYGGNVNVGGTVTLNMDNTVLLNGSAKKSGGNLYGMTTGCKTNLSECVMISGVSTAGPGGNATFNNGKHTVTGGAFLFGVAKTSGGNIHTNAGNNTDVAGQHLTLQADPSKNISAPVLAGGYAETTGGNLNALGVTNLYDAFFANGKAVSGGNDIYLGSGAQTKLTVNTGVAGNISMSAAEAFLPGQGSNGSVIAKTASNGVTADIVLETSGATIVGKDGVLRVAGISVVDADGKEAWYADAAVALADCDSDEYVKFYEDCALELTKDCAVDVNGCTITVSGTGKLLGMDTSLDDYEGTAGTAVWADAQSMKTQEMYTLYKAPNGNTYLSIIDGNKATYHRLDVAIADVALALDSQGLYYRGKWDCDAELAQLIDTYGVVVSVNNMPTANFKTETDGAEGKNDNVWTELSNTTLWAGNRSNSLLIQNIMTTGNTPAKNKENGEMEIYATAYLAFKNGKMLISDAAGAEDDVNYSLYSFMDTLDQLIKNDPTHFRRYEKVMKEFYAKWEEKGMGDWVFDRLVAPVDPADDKELNVIMIGSSFCYYYVEELQALLREAYGNQYDEIRVCNVYYSGCPLSSHYKWWVNNESHYQFYVTDDDGRVGKDGVSLEYCLSQYNWDFISLQESSSNARKNGAQAHFESTMLYHSTLIPYLQQEFPDAKHLWHQTWPYQIGYDRNGYQMVDAEQQRRDMLVQRDFALLMCEEYDLIRVNSGEAWQEVRNTYGYDNLCARIAINNGVGDYYHEGDIGGGQLLNGCVWFEVLTGLDCTQMEYVPTYYNKDGTVRENLFGEGKDITADQIKQAAHTAVQNMKNGIEP